MVARQAHNLEVSGSIPLSATRVSRSTNLRMAITPPQLILCLFAKIAQLVEHDLAKVGVAGSSPVFRSSAQMAESVDALVSNTNGEIRPGSTPGLGTQDDSSESDSAEVVKLVDTLL